MQEKTFITNVRSDNCHSDIPEAAEFTIDREKAKRIIKLQKLAAELDLYQIEEFDGIASYLTHDPRENPETAEDDDEEGNTCQTEANTLHVSQSEFWFSGFIKHSFSGFIKHSDVEIHTNRLSVAELAKEFRLDQSTEDAKQLVSLDGGESWLPAEEGVRIIYRDIPVDGEDKLGEVHINATQEGLITDIWVTREEHLDHNIGTDCFLIDDLVTRLVNENE